MIFKKNRKLERNTYDGMYKFMMILFIVKKND